MENKSSTEQLKDNGWKLDENWLYTKNEFSLHLSMTDYIRISKDNYVRYYGKFPHNNLKLIEDLVCW